MKVKSLPRIPSSLHTVIIKDSTNKQNNYTVMDIAYNQHSPHARRSSRSSTNLNHLTLAPLTSRFPLNDTELTQEPSHHVSYIEGRSAPTTPSILAHSSRVSIRKLSTAGLPKSKSSTHLHPNRPQPRSGLTTPGGTKRKSFTREELDLSPLSGKYRNDSDWLLRAGAAISSSTRESKGQAWLVSRASSTSLTAERDEEEEELQKELAREREQTSRRGSRTGSTAGAFDADDEFSPVTRRSLSFGPAIGIGSRPASRFGSRANSRRGSRAQLLTPMAGGGQQESYFDRRDFAQEEFITEPDFVDAEEDGDEDQDEAKKDDAVVRKLARGSNLGLGGLVERLLGWNLFAVDEDGEETETETMDEKEDSEMSSRTSRLNLRGVETPMEEKMPTLKEGDTGGWQDAAWLLSVATKVLL